MQHLRIHHLFFILCSILITATCAFAYSGVYTAANPGFGFQFGSDTGQAPEACSAPAPQQTQVPVKHSAQPANAPEKALSVTGHPSVLMVWPSFIVAH